MRKKVNVIIDRILKGKYFMLISLKIILEIYKICVYIYMYRIFIYLR